MWDKDGRGKATDDCKRKSEVVGILNVVCNLLLVGIIEVRAVFLSHS